MNKFYCYIFLLSFSTMINNCLLAQGYNFTNFTIDDGLISNEVYCSFQDKDGSMLFGTDRGLQRFNGQSFSHIPFGDSKLTKSAVIFNILPDSNQTIWINTYRNGLFYLFKDTLRTFVHNNVIKNLNPNPQKYFAFGPENHLYFMSHGGADQFIHKLDPQGKLTTISSSNSNVITILSKKAFLKARKRNFFAFTLNDKVLFRKSNTLLLRDIYNYHQFDTSYVKNTNIQFQDSSFTFFQTPKPPGTSQIIDFYTFLQEKTHLWIGFQNQLNVLDSNYQFLNQCTFNKAITDLKKIGKQTIVCTLDGAFIAELKKDRPSISSFLPNQYVSHCFIDSEKGIWLCTTNKGIFYLPNRTVKTPNNSNINSTDILCLNSYENKLAIGDRSGNLWHLSFPHFHKLASTNGSPSKYIYMDDHYLESGHLKSWISTNTHFSENFRSNGSDVYGVPDSDTLIAATDRFGLQFLKKGESFQPNTKILLDTHSTIYSVHKFNNIIYTGVHNGIRIYDVSGKYKGYFLPSRISDKIEDIKDFNNQLIFSTRENGIYICSQDSLVFHLNAGNSILSNVCGKMAIQNDSICWVSSLNGLFKLTISSKGIPNLQLFNVDYGLNSNRINALSISNGVIFIGTNKGLCYASLADLEISKDPIPFSINATNLNQYSLVDNDTLHLPKGKRDVYIEVQKMSFKHKENLLYSFHLNNIDSGNILTLNNSIFLSNLKPGPNQVEVNIASANRIWNSKPVILHIWVSPYFYEQLWFKILSISLLFLIGGISLFFAFKIREKRQKQRLDIAVARQEATISQYNALSLQLNPHFIFNSLNNIQYLSVSKNYVAVNQFVANLAKLTRNILEHSKLQLIPLETEIDNLRLFLDIEAIRFEHKPITIDFSIDSELDLQHLLIPPMIIQPSVENAIWHGLLNKEGERLLKIHFSLLQDGFKVEITDNGIGLNTKQKGEIKIKGKTSVGVKNTKERIELYNRMNLGNANFSLEEIQKNNGQASVTIAIFTFSPNQNRLNALDKNEN